LGDEIWATLRRPQRDVKDPVTIKRRNEHVTVRRAAFLRSVAGAAARAADVTFYDTQGGQLPLCLGR